MLVPTPSSGKRITPISWPLVFVAICAPVLLIGCAPTDNQLRARYEQHRESLDELMQLALAEASLVEVSITHESSFQMALNERLAQNPRGKALLEAVGEPFVRIRPSPSYDRFHLWLQYDLRAEPFTFEVARGLAFANESFPITSTEIGDSTRDHRSAGKDTSVFYVPIDGDWFIIEVVIN